jgi:hypothetical protein
LTIKKAKQKRKLVLTPVLRQLSGFAPAHKRGVNIGFGIVVPAIKMMETINRPELVKRRWELERAELDKMTPSADSAQAQS